MRKSSLLLLLAFFMGATRTYANDEYRASVVKIHVVQRFPNLAQPWARLSPRKSAGSGVMIEGKRILTASHVVQYASQILVQADQSAEQVPATVVALAPDLDLAVIEPEDEAFFEGRPALPLAAGIPKITDTVNVCGYPIGGQQLAVTEGIVSRIEFAQFYYLTRGLRIQVDAALNPGNSGGPAMADGRVVGLVFRTLKMPGQTENIGYLVAAEEIRMFLEDIDDGTYRGKPTLFDQIQSVGNEALRAQLGLGNAVAGTMVTKPYVDAESYALKKWDVITHVGGREIDGQGKVRVREDLRLLFKYLIPKVARSGTVRLTVLRRGKTLNVDVPVHVKADLVVPGLYATYPPYFIYGPMVFTSASQELVEGLSKQAEARKYLQRYENPLLLRQFDKPAFEGEQLVVLGSRFFSHRTTKGYRDPFPAVVSRVNGVAVKNLRHLVEILRDTYEEYVVLEFAGKYDTLVFRRNEMEKATEEILEDEGIRYQCSDHLAELWREKKK